MKKKNVYDRTVSLPTKCSLFTKGERNSHIGLTPLFFLFLSSYTFTYLHFYTIKEVCASERSNEWESEYPISYTHIALCVRECSCVSREKEAKKESNENKSCFCAIFSHQSKNRIEKKKIFR